MAEEEDCEDDEGHGQAPPALPGREASADRRHVEETREEENDENNDEDSGTGVDGLDTADDDSA